MTANKKKEESKEGRKRGRKEVNTQMNNLYSAKINGTLPPQSPYGQDTQQRQFLT